ncbi:NAD(P)-binding domain protein [Niveomyces insectorum RCEF 264]|uniref:NAD(P)-binding domain protein n=1 Tax=Niveomyces insectorum RCEF 264 TaxID=1081102 RepID=A0A162J9Z3_9HYPO|nr:NAD(P)-binding domain protein [Niveomyces insectorum RCEF 264]
MAPIKVGIVGFGFAANCFHLPFILPNKDLAVYAFLQRAAPSAPRTKWGHCTDKFPEAKHYQTADDFFADPAIEVVVVASPNHEECARRALNAGKHVVVEKPFTSSSAAANELIALAKAKGKILTVFQNRRFDSDYRTLVHLVQEGALGDVKEADIHFDFPGAPWIYNWTQKEYEPGSGNLFGLGSHTLDQAIALFGRPASVTAFLRANRGMDSAIDDTYTVVLQYAGEQKDLLVTVKTAVVSVMKDQLRFFFGTCPQEARAMAAPGQPADDPSFGVEDAAIWGTLTTKDRAFDPAVQTLDAATGYYAGSYPSLPGSYRGYYENLAAAIRGTAEIAVTPESSRDGIRLIELARRSHDTGATVPWSDAD